MSPKTHKIRNRILYSILGILAFCIFVLGPIAVIAAIRNSCNTAYIPLKGILYTYYGQGSENEGKDTSSSVATSEQIVAAIDNASANSSIKGIILDVDSYGGAPVAGEEIANALLSSHKPTVAVIRQGGASAAYWAATGATMIYASENSDVGSIGSTISFVDESKYNEKEGYTFNSISSGEFKDTGNPDKPVTSAEKNLLQRDVDIVKENFVVAVAKNRHIDVYAVEALADGSSMLGKMALQNKLIDGIGSLNEAIGYLNSKYGSSVKVCWPRS